MSPSFYEIIYPLSALPQWQKIVGIVALFAVMLLPLIPSASYFMDGLEGIFKGECRTDWMGAVTPLICLVGGITISIVLGMLFASAATAFSSERSRTLIVERYGETVEVIEVDDVSGSSPIWMARCASSVDQSDQTLVLVPSNTDMPAPENGMEISYEFEGGRSPEVIGDCLKVTVSEWQQES